jgi:hypothetical protein
MGNIKIRRGEFSTRLELIHADVAAGFPIMTDDYRSRGDRHLSHRSRGDRHLSHTQVPVPVTMKRYYERFYNSDAKVRRAVALLPWKHNLLLISRVRTHKVSDTL